jgi:hypothetical protein
MIHAVWMMQMRCEERGIPKIKSSRMYEWVRKEHSKQISKKAKIWSKGKNNSQYGTMWICNLELKENKKISKEEPIPNGWVRGKDAWNRLARLKEKKKNSEKLRKDIDEQLKLKYTSLWKQFKDSECQSLSEFSKVCEVSRISMAKNFKIFIPEYRNIIETKSPTHPLKLYIQA